MAIEISVKWCPHCGALENVHSVMHRDESETVKVYCTCDKAEARVTEVPAGESYMLMVDAKLEGAEEQHDDPGEGDVSAGG